MNPNKSLEDEFLRFDELIRTMKVADWNWIWWRKVLTLLNGMPEKYESVATATEISAEESGGLKLV